MSRRRFLYTLGGQPLVDEKGRPAPIEISEDVALAPRRAPVPTEELTYGGMRATDGTPINTKRRHREYLKQTGLAMASDFTEHWKKATETREKAFKGGLPDPKRREAIGRAMYEQEKRRRR